MAFKYEKVADLTEGEEKALQSYASYSELLHHIMQGRGDFECEELKNKITQNFTAAGDIKTASKKYQLTEDIELYCGIGNGLTSVGCLWGSDAEKFVGLEYKYCGCFSTSLNKETAWKFCFGGNKFCPVFLKINAKAGMNLVPIWNLWPYASHEGEVLIAPKAKFIINDAYYDGIGKDRVLILSLCWQSNE